MMKIQTTLKYRLQESLKTIAIVLALLILSWVITVLTFKAATISYRNPFFLTMATIVWAVSIVVSVVIYKAAKIGRLYTFDLKCMDWIRIPGAMEEPVDEQADETLQTPRLHDTNKWNIL